MTPKPRKIKNPNTVGPKAKKISQFVLKNPFSTLGEISAKTGISENWLRTGFKRATGKTFTQYQKEARMNFIEQNKGITNKQLCEKLGITKSTLSYLIKDLKTKRKIPDKMRVKAGRSAALPFEYKPMALEILRAISWYPSEKGLSVPDVAEITGRAKNQINTTMTTMVKKGYLKKGKKKGQRQYYFVVPEGKRLAQQLEIRREEKDRELEKDKRAIPGIIRRKESEKERVLNVLTKATKEGLTIRRNLFSPRIGQLNAEIQRLRKLRQTNN